MITERTLKKWRKEALNEKVTFDGASSSLGVTFLELCDRILRMTQELLDQHLLRK